MTPEILSVKHAQDIFKLEQESFTLAWSLESITTALQSEKYAMFGIYVKHELASYISIQFLENEMDIINIATQNKFKKQGYAKLLLNYAKNFARYKNISKIFLEVRKSNIPALNLYFSADFIEIGLRKKYYADNNEDALILLLENT